MRTKQLFLILLLVLVSFYISVPLLPRHNPPIRYLRDVFIHHRSLVGCLRLTKTAIKHIGLPRVGGLNWTHVRNRIRNSASLVRGHNHSHGLLIRLFQTRMKRMVVATIPRKNHVVRFPWRRVHCGYRLWRHYLGHAIKSRYRHRQDENIAEIELRFHAISHHRIWEWDAPAVMCDNHWRFQRIIIIIIIIQW